MFWTAVRRIAVLLFQISRLHYVKRMDVTRIPHATYGELQKLYAVFQLSPFLYKLTEFHKISLLM